MGKNIYSEPGYSKTRVLDTLSDGRSPSRDIFVLISPIDPSTVRSGNWKAWSGTARYSAWSAPAFVGHNPITCLSPRQDRHTTNYNDTPHAAPHDSYPTLNYRKEKTPYHLEPTHFKTF